MAKLQPKAVVKPFASEETNPNLTPTPLGEWAGGGAVTPSLDPEILLENASQGITKMTVQSGTSTIILPPASDIAGLYYSFTYFLKALQQTGIAEYRAVQDYHLNDITKAPSSSKIYRSLINDNIGNPLTDITKWEELDLLALKQATISQRGTLQIATTSDINAGTDNTKALTIANLRASNINFTGTPTAITQATSDNSTRIATTKYVKDNLTSYAPLNSPNFINGITLKAIDSIEGGVLSFQSPSTINRRFYWQAHDVNGKYNARLVTIWKTLPGFDVPIKVEGDANGNINFTYIQAGQTDTPSLADNSTKIPTTAWSKQNFYTKAEVNNALNQAITTRKADLGGVFGVVYETPHSIKYDFVFVANIDPVSGGTVVNIPIPNGIFTQTPHIGLLTINHRNNTNLNQSASASYVFVNSTATNLVCKLVEWTAVVQSISLSGSFTQLK